MTDYLETRSGKLAYNKIQGDKNLTLLFLGGYLSDMEGSKALMFEAFAREEGYNFLRFDYAAHGRSEGVFEDATIGLWLENTLQMIDKLTKGPLLLIGSSMGGWLMLLAALKRKDRVKGLVGIAAAPDFSKDLVWDKLNEEERRSFKKTGYLMPQCADGEEAMPISYKLIQEAETHLLLHKNIPLTCPVKLFHGAQDKDVPLETSLRLMDALDSNVVYLELIKDAGHRFSRESDLFFLKRGVKNFCADFLH